MAKLRLSNPTTDSCDFRVTLSNPFNTHYYRQLVITKAYYGKSADKNEVTSNLISCSAKSQILLRLLQVQQMRG